MMKIKLFLIPVLAISIMTGCQQDAERNDNTETQTDTVTTQKTKTDEKMDQILMIPHPYLITSVISKTNPNYSEDVLNPKNRAETYNTSFAKAVNLGIYTVDMGYATIYDQRQTAMNYLETVKKLNEELGIANIYNENMIKRYEKNVNNRDSLYTILMGAFMNSYNHLVDKNRKDIAAVILAGGFIEGLHLSTAFLNDNGDDENLNNIILKQKFYLKNVITLLDNYSSDDQVQGLIDQLETLKATYDAIEVPSTTDESGNITYDFENATIPEGFVDELSKKVTDIRTEIVT